MNRTPELISANMGEMAQARSMANRFFQEGMDVYDEMLVGEESAKVMYLALLAMGAENGTAGMLLGDPGGGKSQLLKHGHRLVAGIEDGEVANVPHREDLTAAELVGKTSEMRRDTIRDEDTVTEILRGTHKSIIRPGIRVVKFDEINRAAQPALNAAMGILQDGKIEVGDNGESIEADEFDLVVSSLNNFGTAWTHRLDPALISRHAMGAFMGGRRRGQLSEAGEAIWDEPGVSYVGTPAIDPIIDRDGLKVIRRAIDHVEIPKPQRELGKKLTALALDTMQDMGVRQSDGRISLQLRRVARALTLLDGEPSVTDDKLRDAVTYSMVARLGGAAKHDEMQINDAINDVLVGATLDSLK